MICGYYIDEGEAPRWCYLCEPSWSFCTARWFRYWSTLSCSGADLIGFGRSDKPAARRLYLCPAHCLDTGTFRSIELNDINLFIQDWGGLIGLFCSPPILIICFCWAKYYASTGTATPPKPFLIGKTLRQPVRNLILLRYCAQPLRTCLPRYWRPTMRLSTEEYKAGARKFRP